VRRAVGSREDVLADIAGLFPEDFGSEDAFFSELVERVMGAIKNLNSGSRSVATVVMYDDQGNAADYWLTGLQSWGDSTPELDDVWLLDALPSGWWK
jgi:hypothetical protein